MNKTNNISQRLLQEATLAKLKSLNKQHDDLQEHYNKVLKDAASETDLRRKWTTLRDGLSNGHHQHIRDTTKIEEQLQIDGFYGTDGIQRWIDKFEKEVNGGLRRQTQTKLFCQILDQWLQNAEAPIDSEDVSFLDDFQKVPRGGDDKTKKISLLTTSNDVADLAELSTLLQSIDDISPYLSVQNMQDNVSKAETIAAIKSIIARGLVSDRSDVEGLKSMMKEEVAMTELSNLLTIKLKDLDAWEWKEDENHPRLGWTTFSNGKTRAFLYADVVDTLLLHIVGIRWGYYLRSAILAALQRKHGYCHDHLLACLPASLYEATTDLYATTKEEEEEVGETEEVSERSELRRKMLSGIAKRIRIEEDVRPKAGLYVCSYDVSEMSDSIPHDVILTVMRHYGADEMWIRFFEKFLKASPLIDGERRKILRGTHLRHSLSVLFSELVLFLLDYQFLKNHTMTAELMPEVQMVRVMDDIYVIARDPKVLADLWRDVQYVLKVCGMRPNLEKCGTQRVAFESEHEPPTMALYNRRKKVDPKSIPRIIDDKDAMNALPAGRVRWGFLVLSERGQWTVDEEMLESFATGLAKQIAATPSILGKINLYNTKVKMLSLFVGEYNKLMGKSYRDSLIKAYARLHSHLMGRDRSIVSYIIDEIRRDFSPKEITEAWLFWPITAGGLGLYHAMVPVFATEYTPHYFNLPIPPNDWNHKTKKTKVGFAQEYSEEESTERQWIFLNHPCAERDQSLEMYNNYTYAGQVTLQSPPYSAEFQNLREKFCQRGSTMRERPQTELSPYWSWIVFNYGDQVLEAFGSLEFAAAGTVPLHLIMKTMSG